jgi:hypothetical protein
MCGSFFSNGLCLDRLWWSVQGAQPYLWTIWSEHRWGPIYPVTNQHTTPRYEIFFRKGVTTAPLLGLHQLGDTEKRHGLTDTTIPIATRLLDIGISGGRVLGIIGNRLVIKTLPVNLALDGTKHPGGIATFLDCVESTFRLLIQRFVPSFDVISRQPSITFSLLGK